MFQNNNRIFPYKISLNLDKYLIALFNLCYDIYEKIENTNEGRSEIEIAVQLFNEDYFEKLELNSKNYLLKTEGGDSVFGKDNLFTDLAVKLNLYYLKSEEFINKLRTPEYICYFKDKFVIYSTIDNDKDFTTNVNNKFRSIDIISTIISNIKDDRLKASIKGISAIYDFNKLYSKYITISKPNLLKPVLFKIKYEYLDNDLIEDEIYDYGNIWINDENELSKDLNLNEECDCRLVRDKNSNKVLCVKINEFVLLKHGVEDILIFVKQEFKNKFLWQFFKENLFKKKSNSFRTNTELVNKFKEKTKEPDFNKLISNIKHNLYIDISIEVKDEYKEFFQEFVLLTKLNELNQLKFFIPDESIEKEILGIYSDVKIGEKYNLIHYLRHKDNENIENYVNSIPQKITKEKVHILKVELAYYFLEKYFEDVIEDILVEFDIDYLSNVELLLDNDKNSKAEFDFIIFRDNKFYFIETKTTLSNDNVYDTLRKFNQNIASIDMVSKINSDNYKFLLIGLLSNSNLDNYKHFYSDLNYNTPRKDFTIVPFKFNIPFFNYQDLLLECIAEPEHLKLKEFIKSICLI